MDGARRTDNVRHGRRGAQALNSSALASQATVSHCTQLCKLLHHFCWLLLTLPMPMCQVLTRALGNSSASPQASLLRSVCHRGPAGYQRPTHHLAMLAMLRTRSRRSANIISRTLPLWRTCRRCCRGVRRESKRLCELVLRVSVTAVVSQKL